MFWWELLLTGFYSYNYILKTGIRRWGRSNCINLNHNFITTLCETSLPLLSFMKKCIAAILAILYFVTTTGATINFYYCNGKRVANNMTKTEVPECSKCPVSKKLVAKTDCCQHEQRFVKLMSDQHVADVSFHIQKIVSFVSPIVFFDNNDLHFSSLARKFPVNNSPPRSSDITIYQRNCAFLI